MEQDVDGVRDGARASSDVAESSTFPFEDVLDRARDGEERAIELLFERYGPEIRRCGASGLPRAARARFDSEDVAASVFREILRDIRGFENRGEQAFRNWLAIKARNNVRSKLRKLLHADGTIREWNAAAAPSVPEPRAEAREAPERAAMHAEERERVNAVLADLDDDSRSILVLRLRQERAFADIAGRLALPSADAARMRFARALVKFERAWRNR